MAGSGVHVRNATMDDAGILARVGRETFFDTYDGMLPPEDMSQYLAQAFSQEKQAAELREKDSYFFVAEEDGEMTGYARLKWSETPAVISEARAVELQRLYVRKQWIGKQVGAALMRACLAEAQRQKAAMVWLGVWQQNERAIRFYENWGFAPVGAHGFSVGRTKHKDIIMCRLLTSDEADFQR